ncbi:hypothetical protein BHE74_00055034 [Ensete ventricosum]|nr:hypothetical protein BHE74_00055034 [Ensete ventricosum]
MAVFLPPNSSFLGVSYLRTHPKKRTSLRWRRSGGSPSPSPPRDGSRHGRNKVRDRIEEPLTISHPWRLLLPPPLLPLPYKYHTVVAIYDPAVWSTPDYGFGAALVHRGWMHTLPAVKNVLFSSEMLDANAKLVTRDYGLLMKDDCNLVLVKASVGVIWQSGTAGRGLHCFLRLDHRRQLAVVSDDYYYKILWSSNNASSIGDHALLLQINGQAVVYGPMVWLTTSSGTTLSSSPLITASSPQTPFDATFSSAPHSPIAT